MLLLVLLAWDGDDLDGRLRLHAIIALTSSVAASVSPLSV